MPPHKTGSAEHLELERLLLCRLSVLTNRKSKAIVRDHYARFGLSVAEWRAMAALRQFGPASASEICARTEMDKV
ncbi:MAG: helix-turn-helix domain-containing protein, partial [Alphaproteobacteria bacterium]